MKSFAWVLTLSAALAACTAGPHTPLGPDGRRLRPVANPSAIVATELAFARTAQEKGQWTAFRDYAAADALMFVPQPVAARDWLRKRPDPPAAVKWQPYAVWMSCDGSLAVSKGAWQRPDGSNGYFTTVWRRQNDGSYKWVLDQGDALARPLPAPEMISGQVADCSRPTPPTIPAAAAGVDQRVGWSDDRTLQWIVDVRPDNSRRFEVHRWTGEAYEEVVSSEVAAE
jgi:hypothetical protein